MLSNFYFYVPKENPMKVLKKLLFVSVATTSLLIAYPGMKCDADVKAEAPKGVLKELYETATLKQKREVLQIEFDTLRATKTQTDKFRQYRDSVEFDIKNLRLDLEEAQANRNTAKTTEILHRITKKQEELRKSKQDERNLRYLLEEDKLKKINAVLKVK